jgi:threonine/homoserine/homoserine lactone efflux protein
MDLYPLFLVVAAATVANPGPGVLLTLTNSLRNGLRDTYGGIAGLATGALVIAALSATGLGVLLATSARAFTVTKLLGAAYLLYLGVRLWRSPVRPLELADPVAVGLPGRFAEGVTLQVTNPHAIVFFLSVFPQFVDTEGSAAGQFALLVASYGMLIVLIHTVYALTARRARAWLGSERGGRAVNRVGAMVFWLFGAGLAMARR